MMGEVLGLGVPVQDAAGLEGDVGQERGTGAAMADLDVAIALGPAFDAIQEVARVRRRCRRVEEPRILLDSICGLASLR